MPGYIYHSNTDSFAARAAQQTASDARSQARDASTSVHYLEEEVDRLKLICEAMWTLIKENTKLTDEDLVAVMAQLDLSDGQADGKKKTGPAICPKCDRPNSRRHDMCIYCGQFLKTKPFD